MSLLITIKNFLFAESDLNKQIRASVRTIEVPKEIRDRTLEDVLRDPLPFPELIIPKDYESQR